MKKRKKTLYYFLFNLLRAIDFLTKRLDWSIVTFKLRLFVFVDRPVDELPDIDWFDDAVDENDDEDMWPDEDEKDDDEDWFIKEELE